jgi:hypothetical protein
MLRRLATLGAGTAVAAGVLAGVASGLEATLDLDAAWPSACGPRDLFQTFHVAAGQPELDAR